MKILALDLATKTGWAFWDGARLESGVQDFTKQRGESNGMLFLKFNRWMNSFGLLSTVTDFKIPDLIVYEQPAIFRSGAANEVAVGLCTRVQEFGELHKINYAPIPVITLKVWATGNHRAKKSEMIDAAKTASANYHCPAQIKDDNEADAILLALHAMEKFGK